MVALPSCDKRTPVITIFNKALINILPLCLTIDRFNSKFFQMYFYTFCV